MLALTFNMNAVRWLACKGLGWLAPGVYASALSGLKLREIPVPPLPGPDWVRLRTRLGGICGTDLAMIFLRHHPGTILRAFADLPIIPGHENIAVIEEVGPAVTGWTVGTRVCVEPSLSCLPRGIDPPCPNCRAGRFCLCENFLTLDAPREAQPHGRFATGPAKRDAGCQGLTGRLPRGVMIGANCRTSGSWATCFVAHESQLHAVPDAIPDEQAVLVDPLAGSLHGVLRRRPTGEERVLTIGGGIIGLGVAASIRAIGCHNHVTALVRHPFQELLMKRYGADAVIRCSRSVSKADRYQRIADAVGGRRVAGPFGNQTLIGGFDLVYDCVGTGSSLTDALHFARPRGTVVELGTLQISLVDSTPLWFSEVTLLGAYGRQWEEWNGDRQPLTRRVSLRQTGREATVGLGPTRRVKGQHTYEIVLGMIASGKLPTDGLLTHTFDLRDYRSALRTLTHRAANRVVKAAFKPPPDAD